MSQHLGRSVFIVLFPDRGPQSECEEGAASAEAPFPSGNRRAVPAMEEAF
jgi:hypothetical protein